MRYRLSDEAQIIYTLQQAINDLYRDDFRETLVIIKSDSYRIRHSLLD